MDPLTKESPDVLVRDVFAETRRIDDGAIFRVMETEYGQRIDSDRIRNPHGEHAEEIWKILKP